MAMLRWTYTDELELSEDDAFLIDLMKLANRFQLQLLRERSVTADLCFASLKHDSGSLMPMYHPDFVFIFFTFGLDRCEKGVMSSVNVRNCIRFYQTAEELNATTLMNYCGEIIASHWVSPFRQLTNWGV